MDVAFAWCNITLEEGLHMVPEAFVNIGPQLGWQIFWWIAGVLLALTIIGILLWFYDEYIGGPVTTISGIVLLLTLGIGALFAIPYNPVYWHMYSVSGTVESVSNVGITDEDGAISRVPIIELDTVDVPLVMEDPRAVGLQGKNVELRCDITWDYEAADRYYCKIRKVG